MRSDFWWGILSESVSMKTKQEMEYCINVDFMVNMSRVA